jgi:hypothetical protein
MKGHPTIKQLTGIQCHIVRNGIPLCALGVGNNIYLGQPMCGYLSIRAAQRAIGFMKRNCGDAAKGLKIVRGHCPVGGGTDKD